MSKITYPLLLVNFKTYPQGTGKKALELAKICEKVMKKTDVCIAVALQATDIRMISSEVDIPVFAQHIDPITPGSNTGHTLVGAIKEAGAVGTLINHSERKIKLASIDKILRLTKEFDLFSCVCASTPKIAGAIAALGPNCCATEPPELIGSGISISTAQPEIITETVDIMKKINADVVPLCGAGITNSGDVKKALELGTKGILVASGVVKAANPEKILEEMANVSREFKE
ncbi:MAG: triose-phosphate isomerase [Candidatus Heimdallarchaeota archaeon]|nr:triose-phosphate isomerase [Candidatus Heimdallarchaeota archaeon]MBY8993188.1 triose-phosphate isomerase [Candidatus Heimdallarchaeota archaeon]